jgi:hypothetical protein
MQTQQTPDQMPPRKGRGKLIRRFLKGSKALFLLCMLCSAVSALAGMIVPQIVRVTVDNIIGGGSTEALSPFVRGLLDAFGGPAA